MQAITDETQQPSVHERPDSMADSGRAFLNTLISKRKEAIAGRSGSGIEEEWTEDEEHYQGIDDANRAFQNANQLYGSRKTAILNGKSANKADGARSVIFINITRSYTDAASARVADMLLPIDDRCWEIKPTPLPQLSPTKLAQLAQQMGGVDPGQIQDQMQAQQAEAVESAKRMQDAIEDPLVESNWHGEVRQVIEDAARVGSGVLKGPFPVLRTVRLTQKDEYTGLTSMMKVEEIQPASKRIDPWNLFPDPSCGENIHHGSYTWERECISKRQIKELLADDSYDAVALAAALKEGPSRVREGTEATYRPGDDIEREVGDFLRSEVDGKLPYESIKKLRSLVGQEISEGGLTADVPRSKWRALYSALSDDLGTAAEAAGPSAQQAWTRANQYTKASIQRLEQLESVVNRDAPEKIFKAATSGLADGGTQINRVMKSMPVENRREVAAAVLQRLGRARNSAQDEMGAAFSPESFLTNLAAMSPPARTALFANSGFPGLRQRIETMGKMSSLRREGAQVFANPSGTARQTALLGGMSGLAGALATGNIPMLMGVVAAPVMARTFAEGLAGPKVAQFFAQRSALNPATPATAINVANQATQTESPIYTNKTKANLEASRLRMRAVEVPGGWKLVPR
ncbi:hypothetical protein HS961_09085 [Comamonas piscis]|uniref:Uncharacterized protein n=1 Tax=Comamonas piscis TaxID=1562974 RepID=A0A7G5EG55_9BURK|nr:hypothetical protein [Comamonas piscis]QMV72980.1 hypothetical protein HS961_09085 [Comamonas piscis]WSO35763.1 hypothetical protein VUJ63_09110 [Comamonas piscis]